MEVESGWVKPPPQIGGLDHLAVQAPCINVYGRLLPGITNVTDRARYYSFYPWLVWSFDRDGIRKYDVSWVERFRRADCLFTLIATRHASQAGGEYDDHAGATIGSRSLNQVARELGKSEVRYFQNKLGGLGQYYIGILRELKVLDGSAATGIKYTQHGLKLAQNFELGVDGKAFFATVDSDMVTGDQLDTLSAFCPCGLSQNRTETAVLADMFFARNEFYSVEALPRRQTLQSILSLADALSEEKVVLDEKLFRACSYAASLSSGEPWACPKSLVANREKWKIYAQSELLSVAVQGIFYSLLDSYHASGERLGSSSALAAWFIDQPEFQLVEGSFSLSSNFASVVAESASWLPDLSEWSSAEHEVALTNEIYELCQKEKTQMVRSQILKNSLLVIVALATRNLNVVDPYKELVFEPNYFKYYPINLKAFNYHASRTWAPMNLKSLLKWLLTNWGVDQHLRVALRKLRGQSQSTFRIRPTDSGLEVISVPGAAHTRPRFYQAVRILKDVGALEQSPEGFWVSSPLGKKIMEQADAP